MDVVSSVVSLVNLAVQAAPAVEQIYADAKVIIDSLFSGSVITADQQNQLKAWCDAHQAAVLAGQVPPEFKVV